MLKYVLINEGESNRNDTKKHHVLIQSKRPDAVCAYVTAKYKIILSWS